MGSEAPIQTKEVEACLERENGGFQRIAEATWLSTYRGETNTFRVLTQLTESWLSMTVRPYVELPQKPASRLTLSTYLLQVNRQMNLAKFAIDGKDTVVLSVEMAASDVDEATIGKRYRLLSEYADHHYLEVLNLAQEGELD